jgi:Skp family chaperone for outer membrane proteins
MQWCKSVGMGLALVALMAGVAGPASAAGKIDPSLGPAWVDLPRVLDEYRKTSAYAKYNQKLKDAQKQLTMEMQTLAQLRYCTDAERTEALAIQAKSKPSSAEQARLDALLKKADGIDNEASALAQKTTPTDAETKRLAEISKMRTDAARNLAKAEADRRDKLRQMEEDATEAVENDLLALVEKVAKEQKLDYVLERRSVLVGGNDVTDAVIKKLPKM